MYNIYDRIDSFTSLLDTAYHFVLGRKGASVTLDIVKELESQSMQLA